MPPPPSSLFFSLLLSLAWGYSATMLTTPLPSIICCTPQREGLPLLSFVFTYIACLATLLLIGSTVIYLFIHLVELQGKENCAYEFCIILLICFSLPCNHLAQFL